MQSKEVDKRAKNAKRQWKYRLNSLHGDLIVEQMEMVHLEPKIGERDQQKVVVDCANYVGKPLQFAWSQK
jgi:hypothetical protein